MRALSRASRNGQASRRTAARKKMRCAKRARWSRSPSKTAKRKVSPTRNRSHSSGKLNLRMTPELHRAVASEAKLLGLSINQLILHKLTGVTTG